MLSFDSMCSFLSLSYFNSKNEDKLQVFLFNILLYKGANYKLHYVLVCLNLKR